MQRIKIYQEHIALPRTLSAPIQYLAQRKFVISQVYLGEVRMEDTWKWKKNTPQSDVYLYWGNVCVGVLMAWSLEMTKKIIIQFHIHKPSNLSIFFYRENDKLL